MTKTTSRWTGLRSVDAARRRFFGSIAPRERWTPSEWVERAPRVLSPDETSEPGPFRIDRVPYVRGIIDAAVQPGVEQIGFVKGAQVAWSDGVERNLFGYWIDLDPGPMLILCPDKKSAQDYVDERLVPMLRATPALRRHMSARAWDTTKLKVKLDTMSVFMAWGGSSASTKSRPIRYLSVQEPDEIPAHSGTGGSPISKAEKRTTTYRDKGRSRVLYGGTPTTRSAFMWQWWENCPDRRHYCVPCPHCGTYQRLVWGSGKGTGPGVKWDCDEPDRVRKADRIETEGLAYYRCGFCPEPIRDHHKPGMLRRGVWAGETQSVGLDGRLIGAVRPSKRIGFYLPGWYSPWVSFSQVAAEFVLAQGDPAALMDWVNQRAAEPFEDKVATLAETEIEAKARDARQRNLSTGTVPAWAGKLFATVDSQKAGFWYVIRAWGWRYRSQLVRFGFLRTLDEVYDVCLNTPYPVEGGGFASPELLLIDRGGGTQNEASESRTDEIDRFAERAPGTIIPVHGAAHEQAQNVRWSGKKNAAGQPLGIYTLHTRRLKDELARHIRIAADGDGEWLLNDGVGDDYCRQLASEEKIVLNAKTGEQGWRRKHVDNHLWDCEVYQFAAADPAIGAVNLIPSPEEVALQRAAAEERRRRSAERGETWLPQRPEDWMGR